MAYRSKGKKMMKKEGQVEQKRQEEMYCKIRELKPSEDYFVA